LPPGNLTIRFPLRKRRRGPGTGTFQRATFEIVRVDPGRDADTSREQDLHRLTHVIHLATFVQPNDPPFPVECRNAPNKLVSALALLSYVASSGVILLTNRLSIELVQKDCNGGLCNHFRSTLLGMRTTTVAGLTFVGIVWNDGFKVFTYPKKDPTVTTC
jgi:formate dehydrogenase assembly factor FdhD